MNTAEIHTLADDTLPSPETGPVSWLISDTQVDYSAALAFMEERAAAIRDGDAPETIWLIEHSPLYTAGTSADPAELVDREKFPVFDAGRGGRYTYHGPGQRIAYVMLDLRQRGRDVRAHVHNLEAWVIAALDRFNVKGERREGRIGIWVDRGNGREDKIGAIGVRVRHWVTFHGISLNVEPDLSHYEGIVPCGISDQGVTSLVDLGLPVTMADVDVVLQETWDDVFGRQGKA